MLGLHCCVGFSLVRACGGYSLVSVHGLLIAVASLIEECEALGMWASVVAAHGLSCYSSPALEHSLIVVVHSIQDLPGPGIEPASLVLAGGFFTTEPPGKPLSYSLTTKTQPNEKGLFPEDLQILHVSFRHSTHTRSLAESK